MGTATLFSTPPSLILNEQRAPKKGATDGRNTYMASQINVDQS